jgi:hypothetical protein
VSLTEIRILPALAIARLGSSSVPLENFELEVPASGIGARRIVPAPSLYVDESTGAIIKQETPAAIRFRDGDHIRPVAPFLEVHVRENDEFKPLTLGMLEKEGLGPGDLVWTVTVANIKAYRRTGDARDKATAQARFSDHDPHALEATAENFLKGKTLPLGSVRFLQPTPAHPEIRLRFTPAKGLVYGASETRKEPDGKGGFTDVPDRIVEDRVIYDGKKPGQLWLGWQDGAPDPTGIRNAQTTNPGQIYAGYNDPNNGQTSWGYLDDECDGVVEFELTTKAGTKLSAFTRICAGPPNFAPDGFPVRTIDDELAQVALGPRVAMNEISREAVENTVRRAYETVRLMNAAVMNGNPFQGRPRPASQMPAQDSNDTHRFYQPIAANEIVDTLSLTALHETILTSLRAGAPPWFGAALRKPEEIGDLSDATRRKMPAMMRGADARYLTLTRRQIDAVLQLAEPDGFERPNDPIAARNRTARARQLAYRGVGNPPVSHPTSAISNCFPGLESDFRNAWRRAFVGIVLTEHNNFVVRAEDPQYGDLLHCRLLAIKLDATLPTMTQATGPSMPAAAPNVLAIDSTNGVAFKEWGNTLALLLEKQGAQVTCIFTRDPSPNELIYDPTQPDPTNGVPTKERALTVRRLLQTPADASPDSLAVLARDLLQPGELSQGLCSPWQNDYRECACYYWAASRPDYVNIEPTPGGGSTGDMWMQKVRTGAYVPDNRADARLATYDDLFAAWEKHLRFIIDGRDAESSGPPAAETQS